MVQVCLVGAECVTCAERCVCCTAAVLINLALFPVNISACAFLTRQALSDIMLTLMLMLAQVFCVHSEPNYSLPWQRKRQFSSTGSGFIIPGRRILTNAHCVDHHSQVKVRRRGSDTKVRLKFQHYEL